MQNSEFRMRNGEYSHLTPCPLPRAERENDFRNSNGMRRRKCGRAAELARKQRHEPHDLFYLRSSPLPLSPRTAPPPATREANASETFFQKSVDAVLAPAEAEVGNMALKYVELDDGSKEVPNNLLAGLLRIRHPANPDFMSQYDSVVHWYAEVDTESRNVIREIGLNSRNEPIVLGPFGRNDGVWMGLCVGIDFERRLEIDKRVFEAAWDQLAAEYKNRVPPKKTAPRLPVATQEQLVGLWSVDILGGPGSMSDQTIAFLPDGKGFAEDVNVILTSYLWFHWQLTSPGIVSITGDSYYYLDEDGKKAQKPSDLAFPSLRADIQTHFSGTGSSIDVLYLLLSERHQWLSEMYGRCPVPPAEIKPPSFTIH